jgi:hypothetical protein
MGSKLLTPVTHECYIIIKISIANMKVDEHMDFDYIISEGNLKDILIGG